MPGFHLIGYQLDTSSSVGLASADMSAIVDQTLSIRNNHYFFTAPFNILGVTLFGSLVNRGAILCPTFNAYTKFNIWPLNSSTIPASPPRMDIWTEHLVPLPINEEIQVQVNSTGADTTTAVIILGAKDWSRNLPPGQPPVPVFEMRFTCTPTMNSQAYSTPVAMVFEQSLRGGQYAVVGVQCQATGLLAFRLIFNRPRFYNGIPLRPGGLGSAALGDQPLGMGWLSPFGWGEWGRFATTEYPQLECLGVGSSTAALEGRMWLVKIGDMVDVSY